jgi:hypothetical protein
MFPEWRMYQLEEGEDAQGPSWGGRGLTSSVEEEVKESEAKRMALFIQSVKTFRYSRLVVRNL